MNIILTILWEILNTPAVITAFAGVLLWLLNRLYQSKPAWQAYEGAIIRGIRWAEKEIPDGTPNSHLARADQALKYTLALYEKIRGRPADGKAILDLQQGIEVLHAELEAAGAL